MKQSTINFIYKDKNGALKSDFYLNDYRAPGYATVDRWSAMRRAEFQAMYAEISEQLKKARRSDALQAMWILFDLLNEAVTKASKAEDYAWGKAFCAVSMNHLMWLACADKNEELVTSRVTSIASMLSKSALQNSTKGCCPKIATWPVSRKCKEMVKNATANNELWYMELQGLMTALACSVAERATVTTRERNAGGLLPMIRQDLVRDALRAVLSVCHPRWPIIRHKFSDTLEIEELTMARAAIMPVATGLARTLVMLAMPVDTAAFLVTDILNNAWPVVLSKVSVDNANKTVAQMFAGMACTVSTISTLDSLEKTNYVWSRYLW